MTTEVLPIGPPSPFVDTPGSKFCANGPDTSFVAWLGVLNVAVFIAFLLRLRW